MSMLCRQVKLAKRVAERDAAVKENGELKVGWTWWSPCTHVHRGS